MESAADSSWKGYSLAERDRRWNAAREAGSSARFDCILVPPCAAPRNLRPSSANARGNRADCRYFTQMEDAVFILPTDGRAPTVVTDRGVGNAWFAESRAANRDWGAATAEALLAAGMERARIGVTGLVGGKVTHVRAYGGVAIHGPLDEAMRRLPTATFADATDAIGLLRYVKSEEEIVCLRRATAIAEIGIDEMVETARPGVDEAVLYARVTRAMLELGSENYHWALKTGSLDGEGDRFTEPPIGRRLQPNSLITNEVTAIWGGMVAQEVQPIILGPVPDEWKRLADVQGDLFAEGLRRMKPGTPFSELIDFANGFGDRHGVKSILTMHGRGSGNDGPLLTSRSRGEKVRDLRIEKGNAWVFKPSVLSLDGRLDFSWGGDVVVSENGGEPLFHRPQGFISIQ